MPARGSRSAVRDGPGGACRRADRARLRGSRAHPDDRPRLASEAATPGGAGMSATGLVMPTRGPVVVPGGRDRALAWKLSVEPGVNEVTVAPGSYAIGTEPRVRALKDVDPLDAERVVFVAKAIAAELVVIGPEAPLAAGVVDALHKHRIAV